MSYWVLPYFAYLIIGIGTGLAGGLLGIGGGSISVPALLLVFTLIGFPKESIMHYAIGTSLAAMSLNAISASYCHNKNKIVVWKLVWKFFIGIFIGSLAGVFVAKKLSTNLLEVIFGFFACLIGLQLLKPISKNPTTERTPGFFLFNALGSIIALFSNILGVGGGIFVVPLLSFYNIDTKKAIGTSIVLSFIISTFGAIGYLLSGPCSTTVAHTLGYIYLPAFLIIGISSFISAYYGAKLSQKLSILTLRKIFSVCLITIGLIMLL